ncbi:MAG: hypothetical protein HFI05_07940 [Lachnospiraceae bacterium]|jgi:hypothetical protein|nr:hypothetical protein [Lachnospiraceae bacterium]
MKWQLYVDGNTVYGIDETCMKDKAKDQSLEKRNKEAEYYLFILLCMFYWNVPTY